MLVYNISLKNDVCFCADHSYIILFVALCSLQICGGYPDTMSKCAEMLCDYTEVDFIDINCGCPIDLIYNSVSLRKFRYSITICM